MEREERNSDRDTPVPSSDGTRRPLSKTDSPEMLDNIQISYQDQDEASTATLRDFLPQDEGHGEKRAEERAGSPNSTVREPGHADSMMPQTSPDGKFPKDLSDTSQTSIPNATSTSGQNDESHTFPFSTTRAWLTLGTVLVLNIITFISLSSICTQYFSYRIARDSYNTSLNSSSEQGSSCSNATEEVEGIQNEVQKEAAKISLYSSLASGIPAVVTNALLGSYSDYVGRKPIIAAAVTGTLTRVVFLVLIMILELDLRLYYIGSAIDGLLGSFYSLTLSVNCVVADVTPDALSRAVRFAAIEGVTYILSSGAQVGIGYMIDDLGYMAPTALCGGFMVVALVVAICIFPETMQTRRKVVINPVLHIKKVFSFYTSGSSKRRLQCWLGLILFFTLMLSNLGRVPVEILFVMNSPICWGSVEIGIFNALRLLAMAAVAVVLLKVLKHRLSLETIGVICSVSAILGFVAEGFSTDTLSLYLSGLIGILYMTLLPVPRALLSKIASPQEQGALFSSLSTLDAIASLVSSTLYTLIYNATVDSFRGSVFMLMAALCFLDGCILLAFRMVRRSDTSSTEYEVRPGGEEEEKVGTAQVSANETTPLLKAD
ncbi:proton-coupled folate transporter [Aplysia californica]|uniref:Proton-coupled folate transporter n=1 Tax=Aplysia californica TaxID=6500 RepID=A0ABM0K2K7_APLCA|nr:proton-coupled folate transporter [Aplysia californica]XP_005107290.1 proton-coupled folate transporter [Aplysia californica]XP_035828025.1 proton-coupled folate transporter [Aplysia californica]